MMDEFKESLENIIFEKEVLDDCSFQEHMLNLCEKFCVLPIKEFNYYLTFLENNNYKYVMLNLCRFNNKNKYKYSQEEYDIYFQTRLQKITIIYQFGITIPGIAVNYAVKNKYGDVVNLLTDLINRPVLKRRSTTSF